MDWGVPGAPESSVVGRSGLTAALSALALLQFCCRRFGYGCARKSGLPIIAVEGCRDDGRCFFKLPLRRWFATELPAAPKDLRGYGAKFIPGISVVIDNHADFHVRGPAPFDHRFESQVAGIVENLGHTGLGHSFPLREGSVVQMERFHSSFEIFDKVGAQPVAKALDILFGPVFHSIFLTQMSGVILYGFDDSGLNPDGFDPLQDRCVGLVLVFRCICNIEGDSHHCPPPPKRPQ